MALDEPKESDENFTFDDLQFVVDTDLLKASGGICVDFVSRGFFGGYQVQAKNPLTADPNSGECGSECC